MESHLKMPGNELAKIILSLILLLLSCVFLVGIIPTLVLWIAYFLARRDQDIGIFMKAIKLCQIYYLLVALFGHFLNFRINFCTYRHCYSDDVFIFTFIMLILGSVIVLNIFEFFLRRPIQKYSIWFLEFRFFSPKKQEPKIFKTENLKSYSIADELLKWKELKDGGIISEDEFIRIKQKIMGDGA